MNKKGFASSVIIYTIFAIFLVAISIMLFTVNNSVSLNKALNEETIKDIEYGDTNSELEERITALESKLLESTDKITELENSLTSSNSKVTKLESELSNSTKKTTELENKLTGLKSSVINEVYPVGSIYISTKDDTVQKVKSKFGGEWEAYSQGRTLVGVGTTTDENGNALVYTLNETGGSSLISLTTANLPSHSHSYTPSGTIKSTFTGTKSNTTEAGSHTHAIKYTTPIYAPGSSSAQFAYFHDGPLDGTFVNANSTSFVSSAGAHQHSYTPSGSITSTFSGNKTSTESVGSGTNFDIQNPYVTVYMYKRIK